MYDRPKDIYHDSELEDLVFDGVISESINIRGSGITKLKDVVVIHGSLGLVNSMIDDLGSLREVRGDFFISSFKISSPLKSLGVLKEVAGDVILRYSNIEDIGELKKVGGKLSLRDTPIIGLGELKSVGGDLFLPKRLEGKGCEKKIDVSGRVKYWNDKKNKVEKEDHESTQRAVSSAKPVPYWRHQYILSERDIHSTTEAQKHFYQEFKGKFIEGNAIDLEGNYNYAFILFYDLIEEYREGKMNLSKLEIYFSRLSQAYPTLGSYTSAKIKELLDEEGDFELSWRLYKKSEWLSIASVIRYEDKLNRKLFDSEICFAIAGVGALTDFGKGHIDELKDFVDKAIVEFEEMNNANFFNVFLRKKSRGEFADASKPNSFKSHKVKGSPGEGFYELDPEEYRTYFVLENEFEYWFKLDESQRGLEHRQLSHVAEKAMLNRMRMLLREGEDAYRENKGLPRIGEGWISETQLYYEIKEAFPSLEVIHHGSPEWLGRQHLDIYIPSANLGVEYQGLQHYEPVDHFGGEESFRKTVERDARKREKCARNGCTLIYVSKGYSLEEVVSQIEKSMIDR